MKMTSRMHAIEEELYNLRVGFNGKQTDKIQALELEYLQEVAKVKAEEEKYWELKGNDDDIGCSYWCPVCGFQTPEESFWSDDFSLFNPLTSCPQCKTKLKA